MNSRSKQVMFIIFTPLYKLKVHRLVSRKLKCMYSVQTINCLGIGIGYEREISASHVHNVSISSHCTCSIWGKQGALRHVQINVQRTELWKLK